MDSESLTAYIALLLYIAYTEWPYIAVRYLKSLLIRAHNLCHDNRQLIVLAIKGILHQKIFYCLNLILIYHFALSLKVPSDYQGPRGTAQNDKSLKCFISAPPLQTPWRRPSKPHRAVPRNPCAAPPNPIALCLETPGAPRLKTPGDKI